MNEAGNTYCDPFMGDVPGVAYIAAYQLFVASGGQHVCNTMRRNSPACWLYSSDKEWTLALVTAYYYHSEFYYLLDNPVCVKDTINQNYWHASAVCVAALCGALLYLS